jgi:AcrR family transcriptional regulator
MLLPKPDMPRYPHQPPKSAHATAKATADVVSPNGAKSSQRERLLAAMTQLAGSSGYADMSVADLTSRAGVSRQTFYECFADKEDCFRTAYLLAARGVLGRLQRVLDSSDWWETPRAAIQAILALVEEDPETSWLFFVESLAAGPQIGPERSNALSAFKSLTEEFLDRAPPNGLTLDIPPQALLGAIRLATIRNISSWHLRIDTATGVSELGDELLAWIRSYAIPAGGPRWSTGPAARLPQSSLDAAARAPILQRPEPLPRGRHRLPRAVVARNHRQRILHATADVIKAKGYASATVTDIVLAAAVGKDVFYEHFTDKRHAFLAAQQYAAQETFNACAHVFFSYPKWPQRIYYGLRTLTVIMAKEPALAHLRIVEPYAAGSEAIERTQQMAALFRVFLEEGYRYRPQAAELPYLCSTAIVDAVFEIIRGHLAAGDAGELPSHVPQLAYVALAPFMGPRDAAELIEGLAARPAAPLP